MHVDYLGSPIDLNKYRKKFTMLYNYYEVLNSFTKSVCKDCKDFNLNEDFLIDEKEIQL